jgi:hypothetical protein
MDTKQTIGGGLAVLLLGLYTSLVVYAVVIVLGMGGLKPKDFKPGMKSSLTTIGGLVAALVIAELAVTPPGMSPGVRLFAAAPADPQHPPAPGRSAKFVTWIYLLVWVATGVTALVVGDWLNADAPLPELADLGKAWFGLAVAAGYAYLGVQPNATS